MLTHKEEKRLRELAREMNKILDGSDTHHFYSYNPPKPRYTKEEGIRLYFEMEKRIKSLLLDGVVVTRVEISRATEHLFGLSNWGQNFIYIQARRPFAEETLYSVVNVVVRWDVYIAEGYYDLYAGDERIR